MSRVRHTGDVSDDDNNGSPQIVTPSTVTLGVSAMSARVGVRSYMSTWALAAAKRFAATAADIEREHPGDWGDPHREQHIDCSMSAVLHSATFVEAMINELFADAADEHGLTSDGYLAPLDRSVIEMMAAWWTETNDGQARTMLKYQLLLLFAGAAKLDSGCEPYQSVDLVIRLRNLIVHFRPTTVFADEPDRLMDALRSKRFALNGLLPPNSHPFWPSAVLGAGCAAWAWQSAERLADDVAARIGIAPNYQRVR
jgi:hypothetical protein